MGRLTFEHLQSTFGIHTWDKDIKKKREKNDYNFSCKRQKICRNRHMRLQLQLHKILGSILKIIKIIDLIYILITFIKYIYINNVI